MAPLSALTPRRPRTQVHYAPQAPSPCDILAPPPLAKAKATPTSPFPRKRKGDEVVRVLSKPSSTEAPFVCDPRRPPLWPRTLTLAAAAAAPPTPTHVPVGVARRARTPSAPCLATENRGRGEISGPERILIVVFGPENRVENAFQGAEGKIIHLPEALKTEIRRSAFEVEGSCVGSVRFVLPSIIVIHESEELGTPAWRKARF